MKNTLILMKFFCMTAGLLGLSGCSIENISKEYPLTKTISDIFHTHSFDDGRVILADCENDGAVYQICGCGYEELVKVIPAGGHQYSTTTKVEADCYNNGYYYQVCSECRKEKVLGSIPAGHEYKAIEKIDVTCEEEGLTYRECKRCNDRVIIDIIKAEGHQYGDIKTEDGTCSVSGKRYKVCNVCGVHEVVEILPYKDHAFSNWSLALKPTYGSDGYYSRKCKSCGLEDRDNYSYRQRVENDISSRGAFGRFSIPSVGIDIAIFDNWYQSTTDRLDSGNYIRSSGSSNIAIADHSNQEFSNLFSCYVGAKAYISTIDGVKELTCVEIIHGHNTGDDLTDGSYNSLLMSSEVYSNIYLAYTCEMGWQNVFIAVFK